MNKSAIETFLSTRTKINTYYILAAFFLLTIGYLQIAIPNSKIEGNFFSVFLAFSLVSLVLAWCYSKFITLTHRKTIIAEIFILFFFLFSYTYSDLIIIWLAPLLIWKIFSFFIRNNTQTSTKLFLLHFLYAVFIIVLYWATANLAIEFIWISEISTTSDVPGLILIFNLIITLPIWVLSIIAHFIISHFLKPTAIS